MVTRDSTNDRNTAESIIPKMSTRKLIFVWSATTATARVTSEKITPCLVIRWPTRAPPPPRSSAIRWKPTNRMSAVRTRMTEAGSHERGRRWARAIKGEAMAGPPSAATPVAGRHQTGTGVSSRMSRTISRSVRPPAAISAARRITRCASTGTASRFTSSGRQ